MADEVDPSHYGLPNGTQLIDIIRYYTFTRGNVLKYVVRAGRKGPPEQELTDLLKARQYLDWDIEDTRKRLTQEKEKSSE